MTARSAKRAARLRSWSTARTVRPRACPQPLEELDQRELVRDVEMGRRLVEEEEPRLLGEGEGDEDALPLPARQLVHRAVGELLDVRVNQGAGDRRLVLRRGREPAPRVRDAAEGDDLRHAEPVRQLHALRQDGHPSRQLAAVPRTDRPPEQLDPPGRRRQHAGDDPQQGALAAAVRAEQRNLLALGDRRGRSRAGRSDPRPALPYRAATPASRRTASGIGSHRAPQEPEEEGCADERGDDADRDALPRAAPRGRPRAGAARHRSCSPAEAADGRARRPGAAGAARPARRSRWSPRSRRPPRSAARPAR